MTKIRKGRAPAQLSRIHVHDRFAQSFKHPPFPYALVRLLRRARAGKLSISDANLESSGPK
jgi:hypothetical protein